MRPTARHALTALLAAAAPLGTISAQSLSPYDVFVFNDIKPTSGDLNRPLAAGGDATRGNYEGGRLVSSDFSDYSLFAGGNLFSPYSSINSGRPVFGGSEAMPTTRTARLFNADGNPGHADLNFIGSSPMNIFQAGAGEPQSATSIIQLGTPFGADDITNVGGDSPTPVFDDPATYVGCTEIATSGSCLTGTNERAPADASTTLFNLGDQTSLVADGEAGDGTVAPNADVTDGSGDRGGDVANSAPVQAAFQSNFALVAAPVTATPEPATLALVGTGLIGLIGVARRKRAGARAS